MECEQYKPDISASLAELDVDSSGESVFNIRPELSRNILSNDTWLSNIQPKTLRNSTGYYPWIPVDKTRVEVPQTNLYHREYFVYNAKPTSDIISNPPIYVTTARSRITEAKIEESNYERFDPTLGNSLDSGDLDSDNKFVAFPTALNRSVLNISPIEYNETYPHVDEGSAADGILSIEDINIKHERRSTIDVFSPIRQVVNLDLSGPNSWDALIGVRTYGGSSIIKYKATNDDNRVETSALASLSFMSKHLTQNINAVDMTPNPYYRDECIITSDTGLVGTWNYDSRPRAFFSYRGQLRYRDDLTVNLPGGTKDPDLRRQWFSCKYASHPRTFYAASSNKVDLCDMRIRPDSNSRTIFSMLGSTKERSSNSKYIDHFNICALAVPPKKHSFEVAVATDRNILLFDTRWNKKCVFHWQHHIMQFPPDQLEYVVDQVDGNDASQILAWNRYSTSVHVFEYANVETISEDITRSVDLAYSTKPPNTSTTKNANYSHQQDKVYYVAPRPLYGLPTCRYRPAHMAWVTPYPKEKLNEFRDNPTLLGLKILPGVALSMKQSSSSGHRPWLRSWCMLQLCDDGSVRSKLWCRNASEQLKTTSLSSFHRSTTEFHDVQEEYLQFQRNEIRQGSQITDLSRIFQGYKAPSKVNVRNHKITAEQLEDKIIKSVKRQAGPRTLFDILREDEKKHLGEIDDEVIGQVERRLTSLEVAREQKIWHNSIEEAGHIDPVALDLGGQIQHAQARLKDVCHVHFSNEECDNSEKLSSINGTIKQIAIDMAASRHIYGNHPTSNDENTDTQTSESSLQSSHLLFRNLFTATELAQRSNIKINPAAIALASDWDMGSDAMNYHFRRLDGLSMEEVLQAQQNAKKRKRREKANYQFDVQDSQSLVPDVGVSSSRSAASKITASLPTMEDIEFSTQRNPPTPEKTRATESFVTASQPVPGPFGSRNATAKKKKKRSQGF